MTIDFDAILLELGQFGSYQRMIFILFGYISFVLSLNSMSYVFTAGDLKYRCYIDECDKPEADYAPNWLKNAVPWEIENDQMGPSSCYRYQRNNFTYFEPTNTSCPAEWFLDSMEKCSHWVYEGPETTILNEWDLACEELEWRLSFVGTVNSFAYLCSLPIIGYISDMLGRRKALLISLTLSSVIGFARSFTQSYIQFIVLEGLSMLTGAGAYVCTFVLALEMLGPDKRVMGGTIINVLDSVGFAALGLLAWWLPNWRTLLIVMHIFNLVLIVCFWVLPESIRWLLVQSRTQEAKAFIFRMAKINKVVLSETTVKKLNDLSQAPLTSKADDAESDLLGVMQQVLQSRILLLRLLNCCFCWAANTFVYYGIAINSVFLGGNKYLNFTLTCLIDLPSYIVSYYGMNIFGRRNTLVVSMFIAGLSCIGYIGISPDMPGLILMLTLVGKLSICASFTTAYAFTVEVFPTSLRNSLMGICSMVGRVGSIVATQTPTLGRYATSLPPILFGIVAITGGVLALLFPETKGMKLPDSVKASEDLSGNSQLGTRRANNIVGSDTSPGKSMKNKSYDHIIPVLQKAFTDELLLPFREEHWQRDSSYVSKR